jgi:hypothetical protein
VPVKPAFDLQTNTLWQNDACQRASVPQHATKRAQLLAQALLARETLDEAEAYAAAGVERAAELEPQGAPALAALARFERVTEPKRA